MTLPWFLPPPVFQGLFETLFCAILWGEMTYPQNRPQSVPLRDSTAVNVYALTFYRTTQN